MIHEEQAINSAQAAQALLDALESSESRHSMDMYDIVEVIKFLQDDPETDPEALFQVEWAYLTVLDRHHGAEPKLLWRQMANDPTFFCEVIRLAFRSEEGDAVEEKTAKRKYIATNAYRMLSQWRVPPGAQEDGSYNGNAFQTWLNAVRAECSQTGYLEIAMTMVGHVLIHAPADPDGLWIHHSVASALNEQESQHMRSGFHSELYNSRGVHWVDPTGDPERELAAGYRKQAEAVESAGYHRLASTLRKLASTYEFEADRISSREPPDDW
jgi:hypothetical protein